MSLGSNIATVSFKLTPAHYTILQALAATEGKTVGGFVRETIVESLDLEDQAQRLHLLLADVERSRATRLEMWAAFLCARLHNAV